MKPMCLINRSISYRALIDEFREDPIKAEYIERYEEKYGPLGTKAFRNCHKKNGNEAFYTGEFWYTALVRPFSPLKDYEVPEGLEDQYDWALLSQLMAASELEQSLIVINNIIGKRLRIRLKIEIRKTGNRMDCFIDECNQADIEEIFKAYIFEYISVTQNLGAVQWYKANYLKEKNDALTHWMKQIGFVKRMKRMHKALHRQIE